MSKFASVLIEESVQTSLTNTFTNPPKLLFGVSGGPDSMALLYALYRSGADVMVVHINYGMRGADADADQELVEGFCGEWGFDCCSFGLDAGDAKGSNFQDWARNERYRIFRELKKEFGCEAIVTAHHKDDQVETVLQKVLRGSGPGAWQGMKEWDGELFRPLLGFSKKEILQYCEDHAVPYRIDGSNQDSKYARNFIRNELSEELDARFPGWSDNILGLRERGAITEKAIARILRQMSTPEGLELEGFMELDAELRAAVLKQFIEQETEPFSLSKGQVHESLKIGELPAGTSLPVGDGYSLVRNRNSVAITREEDSVPYEMEITEKEAEKGIDFGFVSISVSQEVPSENTLYMDASTMRWPLTLRRWRHGDRFTPLGMMGSQKVSDHLTNRKITSSKKEKALILIGSDSTIYAIIFPVPANKGERGTISEAVKCTESTEKYLIVSTTNAL